MRAEFADHEILENKSCQHNHRKAQHGSSERPAHHIIIAHFQVVVIIRIELIDIGLHAQVGKGVDDVGNGHKCSIEAIFRLGESAFAGEQVSIQKAQRKTYIYYAG